MRRPLPPLMVRRFRAGPTHLVTAANLASLGAATLAGMATARSLGPSGRGQVAVLVLWSHVAHLASAAGAPHSVAYLTAT